MTEYVIEFRSGSYFVDLDAPRGGTLAYAFRWPSEESARAFADQHEWIWFNGGMIVPVTTRR